MKLSIIIPCYNEEDNIEDLINSCKNIIKKSNEVVEFVLVNNGSKDSTANLLKYGSNSQIHFVNIDENIGMGNGIKKGLEYAVKSRKYKYYGWTHADLQIPQESLIEALRIDTDDTEAERIYLKNLLKDYAEHTESDKAKEVLEHFRSEIRNFWMVKPKDMTVLPLNPDDGD